MENDLIIEDEQGRHIQAQNPRNRPLTNQPEEALQLELKKQFGLVARREKRGANEALVVEEAKD